MTDWRVAVDSDAPLNQTPPRTRELLEKLTVPQLVRKLPALHGTRHLIAAFTRTFRLLTSSARKCQSPPTNPTSLTSVLIPVTVPSMPWSYKWSLSFRSSHQNPVCMSLLPNPYHMSSQSHPLCVDRPNKIWREVLNYAILSSLLASSTLFVGGGGVRG